MAPSLRNIPQYSKHLYGTKTLNSPNFIDCTWRKEYLLAKGTCGDIYQYPVMTIKKVVMNFYFTFLATTAERFFRIDKAQEHLHYITDISSEDLYILDPDMASTQHQHSIGNGEVAKAGQDKGLVFTFTMPDTPPKSPG